jgi:hypothetical protein
MDAYAAKPDFGSQRMLKIGCSVAVRLHAAKVKNNALLSRCEIDHRKAGGIAGLNLPLDCFFLTQR